jgi:hypothetical protein
MLYSNCIHTALILCTLFSCYAISGTEFNDTGDKPLDLDGVYEYTISNGFSVALTGWNLTRKFARGYVRNGENTTSTAVPSATVRDLVPGKEYNYAIYQYAANFPGVNRVSVNGGNWTYVTQTASAEATVSGTVVVVVAVVALLQRTELFTIQV